MPRITSWRRFLFAVVALVCTALLLEARDQNEILPPHLELSSFPVNIAGWSGRNLQLSAGELEVLGPGQFMMRDYVNPAGDFFINLFVAFFPSQRSGDTIHSPKNCIPGSGWVPIEAGHISVARADGTPITINRYIVAKGANKSLVLYWYQSQGRVTASEYWAKIFLVTGAIHRNRTDGALVRVVVPIIGTSGEQEAQTRGVWFVQQILPLLDSYVPR
jgi:EpsI family protein